MNTSLQCRYVVLALGFSLAACGSSSSNDGSKGTKDSGSPDSAAGGGTSVGGAGGDSHHGSGGTAGLAGMGGMMMMDGSMMMDAGRMMDAEASGMHAPVMQSAMPLSGGLHVTWMNVSTDCNKIELLRNKNGGAFAVAYTLAGAATSQHDAQATAPGTYCYKARCVKGSDMSSESNEKCGPP